MPASPLTPTQLQEAARLKSLFKQWQARQRDAKSPVSQEQAAESLGFGQSAFSQYLNGKIPLNVDAATKFAGLIGCAVSEFSPTLAEQAAKYAAVAPLMTRPNLKVVADQIQLLQYTGSGGSMGGGVLLRDQPGEIQAWNVTPEWVHKNIKNYTSIANLCIVTGFGNSMQPLYNPGDPLIVDRGIKTVDADATYFFRVGNEGFIKILQRIPGEGIRVISKNKDYETWTIKPDMDFEVFGQVLKAWCGTEL